MNTKRNILITLAISLLALLALVGFMQVRSAQAESSNRLVGTWVCDVPGEPAFRALQTFHADGTFTETSSLLAIGQEGPAHGAWKRNGSEYNLTFQLFAFDPDTTESTGMFRVRIRLQVDSATHLTATYGIVEFIEPDGTIIELFQGPDTYTCDRLEVVPVP
ncbi:MAG: hypothetical protein Fur0022_48360 [Anaerolineales bacterium]